MPNRLANENSPYLLQHAENPVDWYPWGAEALEKARSEDKPIFLSIGYAACHWCHVMAHESFEDPETAAIMNQQFVNIKVDREERPDLDGIYMQAVVALTGGGGWPMSVFLTPEGIPFLGGTYYPPVRRYNLPSFRELLVAVAHAWKNDRQRILENGQQLVDHIRVETTDSGIPTPFTPELLDNASATLAKSYDWNHGGWGRAPKFPQPMTLEFLLRKATRGDSFARDMAVHALKAMSKGGMYDVVGGGFARYSTDERWCTPHFEKMLYDNAQLALVYLHAWLLTKDRHFRQVCEETLDFVIREMTHPQGGFYSSLDADSEGEEGKFYTWTLDEIQAVLQDSQEITMFTAAYNVTRAGNFEGKNILQRALNDEQLAEKFNLSVDVIPKVLRKLHHHLLTARGQRVRPNTDDKILVAWNSLMLTAFAEAGRYLDRIDYMTVAQHNAHFILGNLMHNGRLSRSWRDGQVKHNALLEDYAALIMGLLALYQSDGNSEWFTAAMLLVDEMNAHFIDQRGGFFDTSDDHETLLLRPKDIQDNATPSGNALAAFALLMLSAYEGRSDWRARAEGMVSNVQKVILRYPTAFAQWLQAVDFIVGPTREIAILGMLDQPEMQALVHTLWENYHPRQVTALATYPPGRGLPKLLHDRPLKANLPTAYVCQDFICQQPTNSPEELTSQLAEKHTT